MNVVVGMYYKISILKKEIIVNGKKKSKIYYEDIKEISRGISIGFTTPIDFEQLILVNNHEWEIVN